MKRKITTLACMMFYYSEYLCKHMLLHSKNYRPQKIRTMVCQNRQSKKHCLWFITTKKGIFDTYSLFIENIGKNVKNTTIEVYRNEPNTQTLYFLFNSTDSPISNHSTTFTHENFLLM